MTPKKKKKKHEQLLAPPSPGTIPQMCLCLCVFSFPDWKLAETYSNGAVQIRVALELADIIHMRALREVSRAGPFSATKLLGTPKACHSSTHCSEQPLPEQKRRDILLSWSPPPSSQSCSSEGALLAALWTMQQFSVEINGRLVFYHYWCWRARAQHR